MTALRFVPAWAFACALWTAHGVAAERVLVGSKAFPESWILGEAMTLLARSVGARATHRENLGGTEIVAQAARSGAIDAYPEYTGTLREVVLHRPTASQQELRERLAIEGLAMSDSLGFDDSYALAVSSDVAARDRLGTISDVASHPELRAAFTHEFLGRVDGWPGLRDRYRLGLQDVRGVAHELAFEAIADGQTDIVDVYTTDPQIETLKLRVLDDDRHFFPRYEAVLVYRLDLQAKAPRALQAMLGLVGHVRRHTMARANAAVANKASVPEAANELLSTSLGLAAPVAAAPSTLRAEVVQALLRHIELVGISLAGAVCIGVPLGVLAARRRRTAGAALGVAAALQTVPSIALLALLIPVLGIGAAPAVVALFLYAILPILQGTYTGLATIPGGLAETAEALGLRSWTKLWRVELPLASPSLLAGIRTSAVIAVGTATIAALVGAGGLGDPILRGIALRSTPLILSGAIPAALLALAVQTIFAGIERLVIPKGITLRTHTS